MEGFATGYIGVDLRRAEWSELHAGHYRGQKGPAISCFLAARQEAMAGDQLTPTACHLQPALPSFASVSGLAIHLTVENQQRIAAKHPGPLGQLLCHCFGFGPGQPLHELVGIGIADRLLINATHLHLVSDAGLLQQAPASWGGGGEHEHGVRENPSMQHREAAAIDPLLQNKRSLYRASQAMRCLPFRRAFYVEVRDRALSGGELCRRNDLQSLCQGAPSADRVEAHWIWLIQLGVLRREVDGQGLTERVRLTPMGRELLAQWPGEIPTPSGLDRLLHGLRRHRPRL